GVTMVGGAILGYVFTAYAGSAVAQLDLTGDTTSAFLLAGVATPIVSQALMLAGPVFLYLYRRGFREPLDGLAFGAASALGFTLASALTAFWPLLAGPLVGSGPALDWALRLLQAGILVALINASTTGLIAASAWLHRYDLRRSKGSWYTSVLTTLLIAFGVQMFVAMLTFVVPDLVTQVLIRVVAAIGLLFY